MGLKSYYVYAIITNIKEQRFKVNRRFRDLEWLNDILRDRYKGFSIPPLPEKTIFHNSDAKFLEIRRKEIEQYLEMLARHPVLKESLPFKLFLQCSDVKWDKEQQNLTISKVCFQYNDIEDVLDQIVTKLEARLNLLFSRRVVPFSKDLACIERVLNILEAPTFSLSSSFKT